MLYNYLLYFLRGRYNDQELDVVLDRTCEDRLRVDINEKVATYNFRMLDKAKYYNLNKYLITI